MKSDHQRSSITRNGCEEDFRAEITLNSNSLTLRMTVTDGGGTVFSYLDDNGRFKAIGEMFQARPGRWVGAKVWLFARFGNQESDQAENYIDTDSMQFYKPQ